MPVQRLQHASVPRPPGQDAHRRAVGFYSDLLGLEEVPKPRTFDAIEVTWFRVGDQEIHLFAGGSDRPSPPSGAHFCLVVDDLSGMRDRLEQAGYRCADVAPIPHRPRFATHDPFGNEIEITTIEGNYLE